MTWRDWCVHEIRHIVGVSPCGILSVSLLLLMAGDLEGLWDLALVLLARQELEVSGLRGE